MSMNRDFTWNKSREQMEYENAMAAAAAAGARNGSQAAAAADPNQYYSRESMQQLPFPDMSQAYNEIAQQKMAEEAQKVEKMQRFKELEALHNKRMNSMQSEVSNPRFQMAAMMAMGGNPGALQSLLIQDAQSAKQGPTQAQTDMDSLESQLAQDIFALTTAKPAERKKLQTMMRSIYGDKFSELLKKGARSRMGGWDAWLAQLGAQQAEIDSAKAAADALKKSLIDNY